jgi:hypothetical protein
MATVSAIDEMYYIRRGKEADKVEFDEE